MKKTVFEKFQAKSLGKEEAKSIVGGDYYQCIGECMTDSYEVCEWGAYYPCCVCHCGGDPYYCTLTFGGTMEFPCCYYW